MRGLVISSCLAIAGTSYYLARTLPVPTAEGPAYQKLPQTPYEQHPNQHFLTKVPKTIGIIGGGSAGLVTAKVLSQQGYEVEVLEKQQYIGGVWFENYENAGLQLPFPHFNIPDHVFPADTPMLPSQDKVLTFFDEYIEKFSLKRLVRLNAEVKEVAQQTDGTWTVELKNGMKKKYDFLVLCTGRCHNPNLPTFPGLPSFKGKLIHSSAFKGAKALCEGKKVVVIGGQKSAYDALLLASNNGATAVTGIMRRRLWAFPLDLNVFGMNIMTALTNRVYDLMVPPDYDESGWIYHYAKFLVNFYWWNLSKQTAAGLPESLRPNTDFMMERNMKAMTRDPKLVEKLKSGEVQILTAPIDHLVPEGVVADGHTIPADLVICATGFRPNFFGIKGDEDGMWMYRGIILPTVQNCAFIGSTFTLFTQLKNNLQAVWLAEVLRGKVRLPTTEDMKTDVERRKAYMRSLYPTEVLKRAYAWPENHYYDMLLADMGLQTRRKKNWLSHLLEMPNPTEYQLVVTHRI